jgi:hypothetical protein
MKMSLSSTNLLAEPSEWQQAYLDTLIASGETLPIPHSIIDRDGQPIDVSGNRWVFPLGPSTQTYGWKVESPLLRHTLMSFAINRIVRISSRAGSTVTQNIPIMLRQSSSYDRLASALDLESFRNALTLVMQELAERLRNNQTYWRYWLPVAWFKWGASRVADLGFDQIFAQRLESMRIPGGPKGAAVRSGDPLIGALDHELERPLLQLALIADASTKHSHLQQKLAIALTLAFGRNPLSLRMLFEEDFQPDTDVAGAPVHSLAIPLIKKRQAPRTSFQTFIIAPSLASLITQVIEANQEMRPSTGNVPQSSLISGEHRARPLFMCREPRRVILETSEHKFAHSLSGSRFNGMLINFVKRHKIVSPITGNLLHITPRRMRYTFATDMVDMGLSKTELAVALGHSDTQSVSVYYDIGARIVPHLEKAARGRIEPILEMFMPSSKPAEALPGSCEKGTNRLEAPLTCYLCPAFKPYAEVDHSRVLETLEAARLSQSISTGEPDQSDLQLILDSITRVINSIKTEDDENA